MRTITATWLVLLAFSPTLHATETPLRNYTADYKVSASGLDLGKLTVKLDVKEGVYQYTKKTDASGLMKWISNDELRESSKGKLKAGIPTPIEYHYIHTRRKGTKEETANFTNDKVTGHYNNDEFTLPWQEGIQDKASQDIVLMLSVNETTPRVSIDVVDKGKVRSQEYVFRGKENMTIGGKDYETLKLEVERDNTNRETLFWLAPALGNIPVQFTHKDGDDKPTVQSRLINLKMSYQ